MDFFKQAAGSLGGGSGAESEILKQAEGFLGSQGGGADQQAPAATRPQAPGAAGAAATADQTPGAAAGAQQSGAGGAGYSDLYGSAQTLYEGLQGKMSGNSTIDDQQMAAAASNVLEAADNTSFIKDSQYGQYLDKAQGYLDSYGAPKGTAAAVPPSAPSAPLHAPAGRAPAPSTEDAPAGRAPAPSADDAPATAADDGSGDGSYQ